MEASEVSLIIESEINGNWLVSNAHGVDLRRCLVAPTKKVYEDSSRPDGGTIELWLVLEELPEDQSGYKIVFDSDKRMFGLATTIIDGPDVFLGYDGSFIEALANM